jgi:hypothetical protein
MLRIQIQGLTQTQDAIQSLRPVLQGHLQKAGTESLDYVSEFAQRRYLSGPYPTHLQPRTGELRASWGKGHPLNIYTMVLNGLQVRGEVGTRIPWAASHETDITITPKRSTYLRIPMPFVKDARGALKPEYRVQRARSIPNTRVFRGPSGRLFIWQVNRSNTRGARAQVIPLFQLKRSVFRRGRPVKAPVERLAIGWVEQNVGKHLTVAEQTVQAALNIAE